MKAILLFTAALLFLSACHHSNTKIKETINAADSVAVNYFKGDGSMDTVVAVKIIRDKKQVSQLAELISATTTDANLKCGYDGSLHLFKDNRVIQDIDFRMNDVNCMLFSFMQEGKITGTKLSPEAKQFLESIKKNP